jgi:ribonuclease J
VIIASFSTQIARVQMVVDAAQELGRRVAITGRSMIENARLAEEVGHLHIPPGIGITLPEANSLPDGEVVIMTTGSQGEFQAGISRMARGDHREVRLVEDDTLILSARTIPGNEIAVNEVLNNLAKRNVRVITAGSRPVHVSGHAKRDELKTMFSILRPEYFTPIHGEYRMLKSHCEIAIDMGVPQENVNLVIDGDVVEVDERGVTVVDKVPAGYVLIQGQGEWDVDASVMEERKSLASDGVVLVSMAREDGYLVGKPQLVTSGFVDAADEARLMKDASEALAQTIEPVLADLVDWNEMDRMVRACLGRFFHRRTKRRPLILVTEIELQPGRTD